MSTDFFQLNRSQRNENIIKIQVIKITKHNTVKVIGKQKPKNIHSGSMLWKISKSKHLRIAPFICKVLINIILFLEMRLKLL